MNKVPELLILSGLPACGKTTHAKAWYEEDPENRRIINWDQMRLDLYGRDWKFNRDQENAMQKLSITMCKQWLEEGKSVIIDNTNLTDKAKAKWFAVANELGVEASQYDIDTPVATCVARDRLREGRARVGRAVIERMALTTGWIDWADTPPKWKNLKGQPDIVICDIDGTLSDPTHRLHYVKSDQPKNWAGFHAEVDKDAPKPTIIQLVQHLSLHYWIIIVSGRSPEHGCGIKTEDWLDKHLGGVPYLHLFMRAAGDYKPDYEHKQEILDLLPKERIAFVLDDRQQVVDMWRQNGLTCLQVSEGDF